MARRTIGRMERVRVESSSYLASYRAQGPARGIEIPQMDVVEREIFWGLSRALYRKRFEVTNAKSSEAV